MGSGEQIKQRIDELTPSLSNQKQTTELFEHIILTEEETFEALRAAREKKHYILKHIEYKERLQRKVTHPQYDAQQLFEYFAMSYDVDDENIAIIQNLCRYFSGDSGFNGDLKKGIFLMGGVGVGKTAIMKFFSRNQVFSYRVDSCREAESKFTELGEDFIHRCSFNLQIATNGNPFGQNTIGFCFDDLGTESNGKHFGKEKNVMAEIILNRYDNGLPFYSTHITTNMTADAIKDQYGSRVTDRIRQMFNVIQFDVNAKSRRK